MDTLGAWYWKRFNEVPGEFKLEFRSSAQSLPEIQLQLFNSNGIFISQGIHTDIAPGLTMVPFSPCYPRLDEVICWRAGSVASRAQQDDLHAFVAFARSYYTAHPEAFSAATEEEADPTGCNGIAPASLSIQKYAAPH